MEKEKFKDRVLVLNRNGWIVRDLLVNRVDNHTNGSQLNAKYLLLIIFEWP